MSSSTNTAATTTTTRITALPDLCLLTAFESLPLTDILGSVTLVCTRWHSLVPTACLARTKLSLVDCNEHFEDDVVDPKQTTTTTKAPKAPKIVPDLAELRLRKRQFCTIPDQGRLRRALHRLMPHLTELHLRLTIDQRPETVESLVKLVRRWKHSASLGTIRLQLHLAHCRQLSFEQASRCFAGAVEQLGSCLTKIRTLRRLCLDLGPGAQFPKDTRFEVLNKLATFQLPQPVPSLANLVEWLATNWDPSQNPDLQLILGNAFEPFSSNQQQHQPILERVLPSLDITLDHGHRHQPTLDRADRLLTDLNPDLQPRLRAALLPRLTGQVTLYFGALNSALAERPPAPLAGITHLKLIPSRYRDGTAEGFQLVVFALSRMVPALGEALPSLTHLWVTARMYCSGYLTAARRARLGGEPGEVNNNNPSLPSLRYLCLGLGARGSGGDPRNPDPERGLRVVMDRARARLLARQERAAALAMPRHAHDQQRQQQFELEPPSPPPSPPPRSRSRPSGLDGLSPELLIARLYRDFPAEMPLELPGLSAMGAVVVAVAGASPRAISSTSASTSTPITISNNQPLTLTTSSSPVGSMAQFREQAQFEAVPHGVLVPNITELAFQSICRDEFEVRKVKNQNNQNQSNNDLVAALTTRVARTSVPSFIKACRGLRAISLYPHSLSDRGRLRLKVARKPGGGYNLERE